MLMPSEKRRAAPGSTAPKDVTSEVNTGDLTPICTALQRRAAARLAARFGLTASVALVVATLTGIGGAP